MSSKECPTYKKRLTELQLPESREDKIVYFLWLDDQLDAIRLHITYEEIEGWARENNYRKKFIFNRF